MRHIMQIIADLQLHSKYSRAVSQKMDILEIAKWSERKGIDLVATGDWTHPLWVREIKANLEEVGNGLLKIKNQESRIKTGEEGPYFLLATEVSSIYSQGGKLRRIHNLVWAPSLATVDKINKELAKRGAKLISDGRPILGLTSIEVADIVFSVDPDCLIIPAHAWTPFFSLYGSQSGFDSIEECFGKFSKYIYAIETGLSSSPEMNWRIGELDSRTILSFSDAHSGPKLGREATVFELEELSYENIKQAIMNRGITNHESRITDKNLQLANYNLQPKVAYTIEFYPEEGKYHYTGHRNCQVKQSPEETRKKGTICPVCGKKLTVGVMHRVDQLATKEIKVKSVKGSSGLRWIKNTTDLNRPPYVMSVPLIEILAEVLGTAPTTQGVINEYKKLTEKLEGEYNILLKASLADIAKVSGEKTAEAIKRVRSGEISVDPGYDGIFGKVKIWQKEEEKDKTEEKEQLSLF